MSNRIEEVDTLGVRQRRLLPRWWFQHSPLSVHPCDEYNAGALDMLTLLRAHPEWLTDDA